MLKLLVAVAAFACIVACNPIPAGLPLSDTAVVAPAAATATVSALAQTKGGYIHPKVIGADWKIEAVNQSDRCAPPDGKLPDGCKGKSWRYYNVNSVNTNGKRLSQSMSQYAPPSTGAGEIADNIAVNKRVNDRITFTETPVSAPVPGSMLLIGSDGQVEVMAPKGDFLIEVLVHNVGKEPQEQNITLATYVAKLLWERIPDMLGGPVPNPESWNNKFWMVRE